MRFWVVNTVRRVETRMNRAQSPLRHRFSQTICGDVRLVRNQPQPILEEQLKAFYDELYELQENGILEIREGTPDGSKHVFMEVGLEWRRACAEARVAHAKDRAALMNEGKVDEAKALILALPEMPAAFRFEGGLSMPAAATAAKAPPPAPEPEPEPEPKEAPSAVPDMSWTKADLVVHAARALGADPADLEGMTKRQILESLGLEG